MRQVDGLVQGNHQIEVVYCSTTFTIKQQNLKEAQNNAKNNILIGAMEIINVHDSNCGVCRLAIITR